MTKDFSQYQKIIDQFRGRVKTREFENRFSTLTANIPKTERFLLKMELKRLAGSCTRLIDLRGHVEGDCDIYEHDGRTHFLDDVAIKVFEENLAAYGEYTFGVYEAVNNTENNFRVIYQKEKEKLAEPIVRESTPKNQDKLQYPAKFYHFGQYFNRVEERMNFAIPIEVTLDNGEKVEASTIDISVSGCKFRFNKPQDIAKGQILSISFVGLDQEFSFGDDPNFSYEVFNLHHEEKIQLVGVKRIYTKERDGFKQFLHGYIQGNKRRYKINLDNTISALQARSYEQFALPKSSELPVFMELKEGNYKPRYALTTNNSQHISEYWQDERHFSTLDCLITPERFERVKRAAKFGRGLAVYCFVHQSQGKLYFYTADEKQLSEDKAFMLDFIGFAAAKSTFRVMELSVIDVDANDANTCFTVANTLPKKLDYLNIPLSDEEQVIIARLPYAVVVKDLTSPSVHEEYRQLIVDSADTSKIRTMGHKRSVTPLTIDYLGINYRNQRIEPRFIYKTPVEVSAEKMVWLGSSKDFSVSGMKIKLDSAAELKKGDIVYLSFPNLQKITSAFELKKLPYEVIRISPDKNVLNIRVYVEKHQHIGRNFFKALIEKNKSKLTPDEYSMMSPGLSKGLRNIYAKSTPLPMLFVQTSGSRYKVEVIAGGQQSKLVAHMGMLSNRPNHYNLYPLMHNTIASNLLKPSLKRLQSDSAPIRDYMYISIKDNVQAVDNAVVTKFEREFESSVDKRAFISNALKNGSFFCISVMISRTEEPDMDFLNPELSYIASYAIHRGKQIEQDIWSTVGLIQCIDVTQEVLLRYQMIPKENLVESAHR